MRRVAILLVLTACTKPGPGLVDGGGFVLPDAGKRDAGTPDSGAGDSGPFVCAEPCTGGTVCGCVDRDCGCQTPAGNDELCDPQAPATCRSGLSCLRARRAGVDVYVCSNGAEGTSCSHTADICTTALGCVCLTPPTHTTDCHCVESVTSPSLCDPLVPLSCPGNVCVRVDAPGGAYFVCSDGALNSPCDQAQDNCQTSLGCICPLVSGRERCLCGEPSGEGGPCDPNEPASCVDGLDCVVAGNPMEGASTVCSGGPSLPDGGIPCDPNNPTSCPPGQICEEGPGGFTCG